MTTSGTTKRTARARGHVNTAVGGSLSGARQHYVSFGYAEGRALA